MAESTFADGVVAGMATNDRGGYVPYVPYMPYYGGNGGFGGGYGFGGEWLPFLFLLAMFNMGGFGGFGGGMGGFGMFPWLLAGQTNTDNNVNAGFNNAALSGKLDSISTQLCNNEVNSLQTAYENRISSMQDAFGMQQAFNNCCCENRLGIADLKATVISENCADREALSNGIRDIISAQTAGTQRVLDQLCADKIDAKNEKIADLERQLTMANLAASQTAQTARILADNAAQTVALEQYLNPVPVPAYPVANPNCCYRNNSCGCGNNGNI